MTVARLLPSAVRPISSYEEYVAVWLNLEFARIASVVDVADGVEIGSGRATVPDSWIDLLTDDPVERAKWRARELMKEL